MSVFVVALISWYGWQAMEAWLHAGRGYIVTGRPAGTLVSTAVCAALGTAVFVQSDGPLSWQGWTLVAYYAINVFGGVYYVGRGPRRDSWGISSAVVVNILLATVVWLWFTGVL